MSTSRLVLKILAGTYAGAELALVKSSYVLGRSLDCDIAIEDEQLAEETLKIDLLTSDSIQITLLAGAKKIGVNGVQNKQNPFVIRPYDRLQVEYFVCAIGFSDMAWPEYPPVTELLDVEEVEANTFEEGELDNQINHEGLSDDESNDFSMGNNFNTENWASDEQEKYSDSELESVPGPVKESSMTAGKPNVSGLLNKIMEHRRVIAGIGSVITLMSSSWVFITHGGHEVTAFMGRTDQVTVSAPKIIQANKRIVEPSQLAINTAAQIAEKNKGLVFAVKELVSGFGFSRLTIEAGAESGEVIVSGYVEDANRWASIAKIVQTDVAHLSKLTDHVITPQQSKKQLEQIIANYGLEGLVQVFMTNKGLVAKASLLPADENKWALVEQEYAALSKNQPEIHRIRDNNNQLDIKSVSFGYESYVVTADGNRYMIGSVLKDGYKIEKITPDGLVLRNEQGNVKHYPLS